MLVRPTLSLQTDHLLSAFFSFTFSTFLTSSTLGGRGEMRTLKSGPSSILGRTRDMTLLSLELSHLLDIQLLPHLGRDPHLPLGAAQEVPLLLLQLWYDSFLKSSFQIQPEGFTDVRVYYYQTVVNNTTKIVFFREFPRWIVISQNLIWLDICTLQFVILLITVQFSNWSDNI